VSAELFTETWGAGRPVVFLHGIGASGRYWQPLARHSDGYRGTAVDLLGFGRSPRPDDCAYDVDAHLDALLPVVPAGSVAVAHSTGAVLAIALAERRPDLVDRLLLIAAPLYQDVAQARNDVRQLGFLARVTVSGEIAGRLTMLVMHSVVKPISTLLPLGLPKPVVEDFWRHNWRSYSRTLRNVVVGYPGVPVLGTLQMPCTLLYGTEDKTATRRSVSELLAINPYLDAVETKGGHQVAVQAPQRVAQVLRDVLSSEVCRPPERDRPPLHEQ
jgi:pimeloyl-ACP methyl ester carboxylesterase